MNSKSGLFMFLLCLCLMLALYGLSVQEEQLKDEVAQLQSKIIQLEQENEQLRQYAQELQDNEEAQEQLYQQMQEWLEAWNVSMAEVTAYAPLDPGAIEGMCYEGNPGVTASEKKSGSRSNGGSRSGCKVWDEGLYRLLREALTWPSGPGKKPWNGVDKRR